MFEPKLERLTLILPVVDARPTRPSAPSSSSASPSFGDHLQRAAQPAANPPPERTSAGEARPNHDAASESSAARPKPTAHDRDGERRSPRESDQAAPDGANARPPEDPAEADETTSLERGENVETGTTSADGKQDYAESVSENAITVQEEATVTEIQPNIEPDSTYANIDAVENKGGEHEGEAPPAESDRRRTAVGRGQEPDNRPAETLRNLDAPLTDTDAADARARNTAPQSKTQEQLTADANTSPRSENAQRTAENSFGIHDSEPTVNDSPGSKRPGTAESQVAVSVEKRHPAKGGVERAVQLTDAERTETGDVNGSRGAQATALTDRPSERKQSKRAVHDVLQVDKNAPTSGHLNHRDTVNNSPASTPPPDMADPPAAEKIQVASDDGGESPESAAKAASETSSATEPRSSRRIALPVGTQSGRATGEGDGPDTVQRARFVQRVARAFNALGDRGGPLRLRLSPPELGSLRMEVAIRNGLVTAHIEAESPQARAMLLENLPALRDRLAAQDIKIERFDVDLMDQSPDGLPQTPQEDRRAAQQERRAAANVKRTTQTANEPRNDEVARPSPAGDGQLNVVV